MNILDTLFGEKNKDVWTVSPEDSVFDAIKLMSDKAVGALPVVLNEKLVGMISERDYARKVILESRSSKETQVKDIMTARVFHIIPNQKVDECMAIMTEHHIRYLPVIEGEKLIGIISVGDVVKYIISDQKFKIEQLEHTISWSESY